MENQRDHILGQKTNLNKFKNIEVILISLSDHNGRKLDINYKKKTGITTNKV